MRVFSHAPGATKFNLTKVGAVLEIRGKDVNPNGKFLYAGNRGAQMISIYGTNPDGSLGLVKNTSPQFGDYYCAGYPVPVDPSGKFLYTFGESVLGEHCSVGLHTQNELVGFSIDPSTGNFNPLPGSPFKVPRGSAARRRSERTDNNALKVLTTLVSLILTLRSGLQPISTISTKNRSTQMGA